LKRKAQQKALAYQAAYYRSHRGLCQPIAWHAPAYSELKRDFDGRFSKPFGERVFRYISCRKFFEYVDVLVAVRGEQKPVIEQEYGALWKKIPNS
jgi:hypothetical protein